MPILIDITNLVHENKRERKKIQKSFKVRIFEFLDLNNGKIIWITDRRGRANRAKSDG